MRRVSRPRWHVVLGAVVAMLALGAIALEVAARAYWRIEYQLSFRRPNHVLYAFYPELKAVDDVRPRRGDGYFNVLMLGGSALHHTWGEVEPALAEQLDVAGLRNVRIFNFGVPAHTSRDSWLKYSAIDNARFDLVIVYDGINDTRTNNVPPELFRDDYSHYSWYGLLNAVAPSHGRATFALPYTLRYAIASARQAMAPNRYVPTHEPTASWVQYGGNLLSVSAFEQNVNRLIAIAAERGDPLMLMTFASWVPDNYSREAFIQKRLDYRLHRLPLELWGRREHVMAALAAHNEVVRRAAAGHRDILFVDQARLMTGSARNFDDPFHLTIDGSMTFAKHIVEALGGHLRLHAGQAGGNS